MLNLVVNQMEAYLPRSVVRISIGFRVLVVDAMVARPMIGGILEGHRLEDHQQHAQRKSRLVRTMRPQPMGAGRNTKTRSNVQEIGCKTKPSSVIKTVRPI